MTAMDPAVMEIIVDARRYYKQNPIAFEQAVEKFRHLDIAPITTAADLLMRIARSGSTDAGVEEL